ncbi:hypothetical protein D9758_009574 [Tetrapyrgos nigripes]|uniref:SUN domain-containing protein n=1 Tax=Tetrapyrgos nigripes TaxID=182062 RepID=A0A8H5GCT4_9AGAR|nr:hypothetical protein D9758_009574 [Tetrapyrgos nigripes]
MLLLLSLLLFSTFVFSYNHSFSIKPAPTTPQDQFYAISTHAPKKEEPPICCLVPLPPLPGEGNTIEGHAEEVLLSFEEWKEKEREKGVGGRKHVEKENNTAEEADTPSADEHLPEEPSENTVVLLPLESQERLSPHFQVPLTDRFNYASLDCSARVHTAHRSAKSPSNILSGKRDRYMLSPCVPNEQQFVVVELCDDIRIDTVQLANFEFFSGVFRDFTVSVAKTYVGEGEKKKNDWVVAGSYRAKNYRGVQSFHPPRSLTDFYRFLRIDFHSHYSNEYYCPISLLRVYGLTHLEEWKWEIWEAESRAKREQELPEVIVQRIEDEDMATDDALELFEDMSTPSHPPYIVGVTTTTLSSLSSATLSVVQPSGTPSLSVTPSTDPNSVIVSQSSISSSISSMLDMSTGPASISGSVTLSSSSSLHTSTSTSLQTGPSSAPTLAVSVTRPIESVSVSINSGSEGAGDPSDHSISASIASISSSSSQPHTGTDSSVAGITATNGAGNVDIAASAAHSSSSLSSSLSVTQVHGQPYFPPIAPVSGGGESIYRIIMNRLGALEGNHSLYTRYVEQQTTTIRGMLSRLSEDVGRLEGIRKSQSQAVWRIQREREKENKERKRLESEFLELVSRVEYLNDEITLEKRLGIAQICILLTVIVFMGLTRGSRGSEFDHHHSHGSVNLSRSALGAGRWKDGVYIKEGMRAWGRRHLRLSLSGLSAFSGRSSRSQSRSGGADGRQEDEKSILRSSSEGGAKHDQQLEEGNGEESMTLQNGERKANGKLQVQVKRERHNHDHEHGDGEGYADEREHGQWHRHGQGHEPEHGQHKFDFPTSPVDHEPILPSLPSSSYNLTLSHKSTIHSNDDWDHGDGHSTSHYPYSSTIRTEASTNDHDPDHRRVKTAGLYSYSSYWGADTMRSRSRSHSRSRTPSLKSRAVGTGVKASTSTSGTGMKTPRTPTRRPRPQLRRSNSESHGSSTNSPSIGFDPSPSMRAALSTGLAGLGVLGLTPSVSWGGGGSGGQVPRSAKRWARSAHLHEVKRRRDRDGDQQKGSEKDNKRDEGEYNKENADLDAQKGKEKESDNLVDEEDVFSSPSATGSQTTTTLAATSLSRKISQVSLIVPSPSKSSTAGKSQRSPLSSRLSPGSSRSQDSAGDGEDDTDAWATETDIEAEDDR